MLNQVIKIKEKTGLTIEDVAKRAEISSRTIRRWRNGTKPHPLLIKALEEALEDIRNFYRERGIEI